MNGRTGYEAYAQSTGGKTFDGRAMPTFDEILERSPHVAQAWEDAASAMRVAVAARILGSRDGSGSSLTFGDALLALKVGAKVARAGWNGKGMWVALTPGTEVPKELARAGAAQHRADEITRACDEIPGVVPAPLRILPHLDMRAADGSLVIGWLASQTDMLAEDWSVVS